MKRVVVWVGLLALGVGAPPVAAQGPPDTTARIVGTVRSSINGQPVSGVMVAVQGARVFGVSDSAGAFTLEGLPPGRQTVRILYGDSLSFEQQVTLKRGKQLTLAVLLDVSAVELSPVVVEARSLRAMRSLAGFYDRRKRGFGRFYTLEDLDRLRALSLRGLLFQSGVNVRCGLGDCVAVAFGGMQRCTMSVYLDGMQMPSFYFDVLRPEELAGVEVYRHALDVPLEFQNGFGSGGGGGCGAVVMWSRY